MANFLGKLAIVGGGIAAAGGGVAAGSPSLFRSSKESVEKTKVKNHLEETNNPASTNHSCIIWEAESPVTENGKRKFTKLLKKHESKNAFFEWKDNPERKIDEKFKSDVEMACQGEGGKKNVQGRVYVWWDKGKSKWIYASDMNNGNHNWENEIQQKPGNQ